MVSSYGIRLPYFRTQQNLELLTEKTISEQLRRNQTRLRKQTLGKLIKKFNKNILGDASQIENLLLIGKYK
jgi:hypothetical protein